MSGATIMALGVFTLMFVLGQLFPPGQQTTRWGRFAERWLIWILGVPLAIVAMSAGGGEMGVLVGGALGFAVYILVTAFPRR